MWLSLFSSKCRHNVAFCFKFLLLPFPCHVELQPVAVSQIRLFSQKLLMSEYFNTVTNGRNKTPGYSRSKGNLFWKFRLSVESPFKMQMYQRMGRLMRLIQSIGSTGRSKLPNKIVCKCRVASVLDLEGTTYQGELAGNAGDPKDLTLYFNYTKSLPNNIGGRGYSTRE